MKISKDNSLWIVENAFWKLPMFNTLSGLNGLLLNDLLHQYKLG